jgi:hypothetical protein
MEKIIIKEVPSFNCRHHPPASSYRQNFYLPQRERNVREDTVFRGMEVEANGTPTKNKHCED